MIKSNCLFSLLTKDTAFDSYPAGSQETTLQNTLQTRKDQYIEASSQLYKKGLQII